MSGCHIIVGATNTGKTFYLKKFLDKIPNKNALLIYDVNNEYKNYFNYPLIPFEDFVYKASLCEHAVMVFEEATIFLNNRSCNEDLYNILVRKRHTDNYIFLVFHSLRSIPRYIYELSNYITIFKTNDTPYLSAKELKDERIEEIMERVKNSKNIHINVTLKIY
jgi:hypothetical protein